VGYIFSQKYPDFNFVVSFVLQLSVSLKLYIVSTPLHFLLCQSCCSLRNVSVVGQHMPFLGLITRSYHGWLSMMASLEPPFSALPRAPQPCVHHCLVEPFSMLFT